MKEKWSLRFARKWGRLALVALLATVALLASPAPQLRADDPCADPQVRAAMEQAQQAYAQALQAYSSLPPEARAQLDAAVRQATGYTIPQLRQLIIDCRNWRPGQPVQPTSPPRVQPTSPPRVQPTALPGLADPGEWLESLVKQLRPPDLADLRERLESLVKQLRSPATPTGLSAPTSTPRPPSTRTSPLASALAGDGAVYIGSGQLKLGWQLFGRTDMSEEEAAKEYGNRLKAREDALKAQLAEANKGLAQADNRIEKYKEVLASKNDERLAEIRKKDLGEAQEESEKEWGKLALHLGGALGEPIGSGAHAASAVLDFGKFQEKLASGERLTWQEYESLATAMASGGAILTHGTPVGIGLTAGLIVNSGMKAGAAQWCVYTLEKGIQDIYGPREANFRRLEDLRNLEKARKEQLEERLRELAQEGRYLDFWRP